MSTVNMPTVITAQVAGAIAAGAGQVTIAAPFDGSIVGVSAAVGTAPTGADMILDVNAGGTSVFDAAGDQPTIAAGAQAGTASVTGDANVTDFAEGDLITIDVDQVGSTVAGSDLTVCLVLDADLNPTD